MGSEPCPTFVDIQHVPLFRPPFSATAVANSELAEMLGAGRSASVPDPTRRFALWLAGSKDVRGRLAQSEGALHRSGVPADEKTANLA